MKRKRREYKARLENFFFFCYLCTSYINIVWFSIKSRLRLLSFLFSLHCFRGGWFVILAESIMTTTTSLGCEPIRSGDVVLFYLNRDGLPLSERCNERMWSFCMEQYPKRKFLWYLISGAVISLFLQFSSAFLCKHHWQSLNLWCFWSNCEEEFFLCIVMLRTILETLTSIHFSFF